MGKYAIGSANCQEEKVSHPLCEMQDGHQGPGAAHPRNPASTAANQANTLRALMRAPLNQLLVYECSQSAASSVMLHSTTLRVVHVLIQLEFYCPFTSLKKESPLIWNQLSGLL